MGALLCSAVSGESPFRRDSLGGILHAVLEGDIRPPAQAAPILPASDLWSFGVVLYAATEGVSPFRRSNTLATLQSVLNATPAAPASVQGPLADVINGPPQKDPSRCPNAGQVRALLETAVDPPAPAATQAVQSAEGASKGGIRPGRKTLFGLGAAVVTAAVERIW
jgi:serine/threonine protein kinase